MALSSFKHQPNLKYLRKYLFVLCFHPVNKNLVPKPLHVPFRTEEDLLARAIAQGPKTVDVPASLPTPPHNNQEELRYLFIYYLRKQKLIIKSINKKHFILLLTNIPLCGNSSRGQDPCKDRDTPDSFVPSSSPESVVGMEITRYPELSLVKAEPPSPCVSPVLPMLPPPTGKGKRTVRTNQRFC